MLPEAQTLPSLSLHSDEHSFDSLNVQITPNKKRLTKPDEAERLPPDPGRTRRHLSDLLHALDPRALPESLVQPGVSPVQVEDVTKCRVSCFFYGCWGNITYGDAWEGKIKEQWSSSDDNIDTSNDNQHKRFTDLADITVGCNYCNCFEERQIRFAK